MRGAKAAGRSRTTIQQAALSALEETRAAGNQAGLVVLATGLGKTWLSAFDTNRPEFRRVLFVAHREEILNQALDTFRRIRPDGAPRALHGRDEGSRRRRRVRVDPDPRPARAPGALRARTRSTTSSSTSSTTPPRASYRKLIDHFRPKFLLGLTATPERTRRRRPARALPGEPRLSLRSRRGRARRTCSRRSTTSACRTRWTTRTSRGGAPGSTRRR